jgi:hypothetical protein
MRGGGFGSSELRMRNSMSCRRSSEKLGETPVLISKEDSGCSEDTLRCFVPCLPCFLHCKKVMDDHPMPPEQIF